MKTVFINCSPKKRFCASAYFLALERLFAGGKKVAEKLRTPEWKARLEAVHANGAKPLFRRGLAAFVR